MRRIVLLLLCVALMVSSLLVGCGKDAGVQPDPSTQSSAAPSAAPSTAPSGPEEYTLPLATDGKAEITIGTYDNWYTPASYNANLELFQELEKKTGVKIKWEVVTPAEADTVIQTRLVAGTNLPDLTYIPWVGGSCNPAKYGMDGIVIPIEDLIAQYAPNINKFFEENPFYPGSMTAPDGHIYGLASVNHYNLANNPWIMGIRKDWLDYLKLEEPKTLDDWSAALTAIKDGDPNKNGQKDEIPMVFENGLKGLAQWGRSWGLHLFRSNGFYPDANGKVQYDWIDPQAKEFITWARKMYEEGLIDPEFLNVQNEQYTAKISKNVAGSVSNWLSSLVNYDAILLKSGVTDAKYIPTLPASGVEGIKPLHENRSPLSDYFSITKDCKNTALVIKWLDYIYASEEGNRLLNCGIEGKSYNMVDGKPVATDFVLKNPDGLSAGDALMSLGCRPNIPRMDYKYSFPVEALPENVAFVESLKEFGVNVNPAMLPTEEEEAKMSSLFTELDTYRNETLVNFIIGKTDMSKWDEYVSTVKSLKIDEILVVKQAQYERYAKK